MNHGKTGFAQLMSKIPEYEFDKCVARYNGNYRVRNFSCRDHFYVMCFAQLTQRDSLRDIDNLFYAFDSSTISLCLKLCPWANFRENKGGITSFEKAPLNELFSKSSTSVPSNDLPNLFSNNQFLRDTTCL